jgi:hypothetical protein
MTMHNFKIGDRFRYDDTAFEYYSTGADIFEGVVTDVAPYGSISYEIEKWICKSTFASVFEAHRKVCLTFVTLISEAIEVKEINGDGLKEIESEGFNQAAHDAFMKSMRG